MITATLASCEGREESLKKTLESLKPQVDKILVYLNYDKKPDDDLATYYNGEDFADMGKFFFDVEGYHIVCDDDLTYPTDYVKYMLDMVDYYNTVVSCHGRIIKSPCDSYYKDGYDCKSCLRGFKGNSKINVPGSGVMAYHTDVIKFTADKDYMYMADIYVGTMLQKANLGTMAIGHPSGWLTHNPIDYTKTIWAKFVNNDKRQTDAINKIEWRVI